MDWINEDRVALRRAKSLLESPGLAVRIANTVGVPIEKLFKALPEGAGTAIQAATTKSLDGALRVATSLMDEQRRPAVDRLHSVAVAATGAVGGAFGLAALAAELPVSTAIMLRSIADIARSEGFSLQDPTVAQDCVAVFALGGPGREDDASETGYYATRAMLNEVLKQTSAALTKSATASAGHQGVSAVSASKAGVWLAKMIEAVASRFGVVITHKFAAQLVPVIGAASGAAVNAMFIRHYQDMARGHFVIRRLEQIYGSEAVHAAYAGLSRPVEVKATRRLDAPR